MTAYPNSMVLLTSRNGSKVVTVLCPDCGRISRQITKDVYIAQPILYLRANHTCPICASVYSVLSDNDRAVWSSHYNSYERQGEQAYNNDVKNTYLESPKPIYCTEQSGVPQHLPSLTDTALPNTREGVNEIEPLMICSVAFSKGGRCYDYISSDPSTKIGDRVVVNVGNETGEKIAVVKNIGFYRVNETPYPVEKMKRIKKIANNEPPIHEDTSYPPRMAAYESSDSIDSHTSDVIPYVLDQIAQKGMYPVNEVTSIPVEKSMDMPSHSNKAAFDRKFEHWKKQLLDLSKRNKMINYRETKRTTLKILAPDFTELFNRLAVNEEELTFQRPIDKDSDIRTFSMLTLLETLAYPIPVHVGDIKAEGSLLDRKITLNNLRTKSKLARDEQGTNILYLSFGFIEWKENNTANAGWLKSPVLMMPVSLKLESVAAPFTLSRYDDEIEVNPTLDYLFNERYGVDLPTFELKDEDSIGQYMQDIEEIADKNGWKLTREISLGLLSFLKISMYHDINNSYERIKQNPVISAITGNIEAVNGIPQELNRFDYDLVSPKDCYQVVNADSSQQEAIMLSKAGVSFVMQGPPGTGKSQTITNIIAEALADDKKVLFVSEKAAALEVVHKRLTEVGLSDFCLALHSHKANKKEILDSIAANLKLNRLRIKESVMIELNELFQDKHYLNQYVRELHDEVLPLEKSLYEAFGELTSLNSIHPMVFELEGPASISAEHYHKMLYNVSRYAKALDSLGVRFSENPWSGTIIKQLDEDLRNNLLKNVSDIPGKLNALHDFLMIFQKEFCLTQDTSWVRLNQIVSLLGLFEALPLFPNEWADSKIRNMMLKTARERNVLLTQYHRGVSAILDVFNESVFSIDMDSLVASMRTALGSIHSTGYFPTLLDADVLGMTPTVFEKLKAVIADNERLEATYEILENITGIFAPCTYYNIRELCVVSVLLASSPIVQSNWCNRAGFDFAKGLLDESEARSTRLIDARSKVLNNYVDSVISIDTTLYLKRFANDYTDNVKNLIIQYENDLASLKKMRKGSSLFQHGEIISLLASLIKLYELNTELDKSDSVFSSHFSNEYKGIETLWNTIDDLFVQINDQVDKSRTESKEIALIRDNILTKWENGVFDIDADAMLLRFRTKYSSFIKIFKPSYRKDMLLLKGLHKVFGEKLTDTTVVALLQELKTIKEKEEQFSLGAKLIAKHFSQEYNGYLTDWSSLRTTYKQMSAIKEKLSALTGEMKSIRKTILEKWVDDAFTIGDVEIRQTLTRFSNDYTPSFYEIMCQYKSDMDMFIAVKTKEKASMDGAEIIRLLHDIDTINSEMRWFNDDANQLLVKTFGNDFKGYNTKWSVIAGKLEFISALFNQLNCDIIPDTIKNFISDSSAHDIVCQKIARIVENVSNDKIDNAILESRSLLMVADETNIKDLLLPSLYSLQKYFSAIADSVIKLQECALSKIPYDTSMGYAQDIQASNNLRHELLSFGSTDSILFGSNYRSVETNWDDIINDLMAVSAFFETSDSELLTAGFLSMVCDDAKKRGELTRIKETLENNVSELQNGYNVFSSLFDEETNIQSLPLTVLANKIITCMDNFMLLENWLACEETKIACDELGLADFTAKIEKSDNTIEDIVSTFNRGFYTAWAKSVIVSKKAVERFRRHVHDSRIGRFVALDDRQLYIARERIRQNVIDNIPDGGKLVNANDELSILRHEIGKKRRIMPLRKLFKAIPNLLLKLKPCLMMSPLSVAYFLEAESYEFDIVIFDEASQIFPQDAIGAIFRGKQVIVAGDSKQLPPTNFFATSTSNNEDDYDSDDEDELGSEIFDSILEETTGVLPNKRLLWHYRSRHENLIAFSNQGIYDNDLITFPSSIEAASDTGVEFVFVEDGIYEGKGRNTGEARRCVALVKTHIERNPTRSLGIIAFSESQQKTIANEIQKFREQNPEYEDFFTEDRENEFFVKNLENVQGDERDTIIFSISYAKTKDQRENDKEMALRFGPLGQKGGERRLNVAITRAKHNVKLVSSIVPHDINLSRTESEGVKMLRSYIEFAMRGSTTLQSAHNNEDNDVFIDIVAEFLVSKGYKLKKYVGCSGYKIDIAILHPERENCFVAGIEGDGFAYKAAKTARDRDHLRKSILKSMGWNIYRVWSPEWMARPEIEQQKLIAFINTAISEYSVESTAKEKESCKPYKDKEVLSEVVYEDVSAASHDSVELNGNGNPYGFDDYVEAIWSDAPVNKSGKITESEAIKYIVGIEQPMSIDLLYQRMAKAYGNQKATVTIRNNVDKVMRHPSFRGLVQKDNDGFVTLTGFSDLKVRIPAPGSAARQITFISLDEIGLAMTTIASQAIGISSDGLIEATARALGYARKGERVMSCMNKALERLVNIGRVRMVDGKVNVIGGRYRG